MIVVYEDVAMKNRMRSILLLLQASVLIGTVGCVHPISYGLRAKAEQQDLAYSLVARDPDSYKGQTVIWGGIIILIRSIH